MEVAVAAKTDQGRQQRIRGEEGLHRCRNEPPLSLRVDEDVMDLRNVVSKCSPLIPSLLSRHPIAALSTARRHHAAPHRRQRTQPFGQTLTPAGQHQPVGVSHRETALRINQILYVHLDGPHRRRMQSPIPLGKPFHRLSLYGIPQLLVFVPAVLLCRSWWEAQRRTPRHHLGPSTMDPQRPFRRQDGRSVAQRDPFLKPPLRDQHTSQRHTVRHRHHIELGHALRVGGGRCGRPGRLSPLV
mmetsp:Transcript_4492/g.11903  ORF Transcript_4492/g.11903 Transcript_4492/m.11903 type:complete len:242 (+) Transcript_4492:478-1203(+)